MNGSPLSSLQSPAPEALLDLLRTGREGAFLQQAQSLASLIGRALNVKVLSSTPLGRSLRFTLERLDIALRGFSGECVHALILAGSEEIWSCADASFRARIESPVDMPLVFACGPEEYADASRKVGGNHVLVISPAEIIRMLASSVPLECLKSLIRSQFTPGMLHPFEHQKPVEDALFKGRHDFLQRLRDNPSTNFALVGPSKMGKTSLVKRYLSPLSGMRSSRSTQVYVDLFDRAVTELSLARAIRMALDPGSPAYNEPAETLSDFLGKVRSRIGPLEIVLDETDRHLDLESMRVLIHLAVRGLCRLILVGRWRLMKMAMHTQDDNFNRLEPAVLTPLSVDEAMEIVERPLADLGFERSFTRHELRSAINRLGRVPGLVQELGAFLVEESRGTLEPESLKRALNRVITSSRLLGLLKDLSSPVAQSAALLLALEGKQQGGAQVDPLSIQGQFLQRDIVVPVEDCMEICDELVIHHLLGYSEGDYRMARWDIVAEGQGQRRLFMAMLEEKLAVVRRTHRAG